MESGSGYIVFQQPTQVNHYGVDCELLGRTFEEAFIYQNITLFHEDKISSGIDFNDNKEHDYQAVYEAIRNSSFKKTEFALDVASSSEDWETPNYILEGLRWLKSKTCVDLEEEAIE